MLTLREQFIVILLIQISEDFCFRLKLKVTAPVLFTLFTNLFDVKSCGTKSYHCALQYLSPRMSFPLPPPCLQHTHFIPRLSRYKNFASQLYNNPLVK